MCYRSPEKQAKVSENYSRLYRHPWSKYKKDYCEACGFVAEHYCQLDVDHIDGNKKNNDPSNFQTLCANCHRLKTFKNRDNIPRGQR